MPTDRVGDGGKGGRQGGRDRAEGREGWKEGGCRRRVSSVNEYFKSEKKLVWKAFKSLIDM